jgi:CheY-like chemotaxis protein
MLSNATILLAEDNDGHARLIRRNLKRGGLNNELLHFEDGRKVMDFLQMEGDGPKRQPQKAYILLLDIRMPVMDGIEVLKIIKNDDNLKVMPVVMVTSTDASQEIERCYNLGCCNFIIKPVGYDEFIEAMRTLVQSLKMIETPVIA